MASRTLNITDELYQYILNHSVREPELFARLRVETAELPQSMMQISPDQGQFMRLLVELIGAKKTLEVGTFTGYSALSVASALPEDGMVYACDVSEEWTSIGRKYWVEAGVDHKITLTIAPAADTLAGLIADGHSGTFDFAFIDADKSNYDTYYEHALTLLRSGGLIAVDNVLWGGSVNNPDKTDDDTMALKAINKKLHSDDRVNISMVTIGDGLFLARKL